MAAPVHVRPVAALQILEHELRRLCRSTRCARAAGRRGCRAVGRSGSPRRRRGRGSARPRRRAAARRSAWRGLRSGAERRVVPFHVPSSGLLLHRRAVYDSGIIGAANVTITLKSYNLRTTRARQSYSLYGILTPLHADGRYFALFSRRHVGHTAAHSADSPTRDERDRGAACAGADDVALMTYLTWQSIPVGAAHAAGAVRGRARARSGARSPGEHRRLSLTNDTSMLALERNARARAAARARHAHALTVDNAAQQLQLELVDDAIRNWDSSYVDPLLAVDDAAERARIGRERARGLTVLRGRARAARGFSRGGGLTLRRARAAQHALALGRGRSSSAPRRSSCSIVLLRLRRELLERAARWRQQAQLEEQAIELEAQAAEAEMLTAICSSRIRSSPTPHEQEMLTADLEVANQELTEAAVEAEEARDAAIATRGALSPAVRLAIPRPCGCTTRRRCRFLEREPRRGASVRLLRGRIPPDDASRTFVSPEDVPLLRSQRRGLPTANCARARDGVIAARMAPDSRGHLSRTASSSRGDARASCSRWT